MDIIIATINGFWTTLCQMAPYLLFGFAVAGTLSVLISPQMVERHLGNSRNPLGAIIKATLFGIPLPLCSCGVIPVAASLRRHGASRGATTSFLISTPQTGVDSILVTYSLLGPVFTVFRPVVALLSGIVGGAAAHFIERETLQVIVAPACEDACCGGTKKKNRFLDALHYGFVALPQDIGTAMLIGVGIAGLIGAIVPPDYFHEILAPLSESFGPAGASIAGMAVMGLIGIPVYVCATASVPIAAALIAKGVAPGAAIVFLMTGPATNAATIAMIWKVMGKRTAATYLTTVAGMAFLSGLALDLLFPGLRISVAHHMHHSGATIVEMISAVILIGVLGFALLPKWLKLGGRPAAAEDTSKENPAMELTINVEGMTCNHCVNSVKRALTESPGVESAEVDLAGKKAVVKGDKFDAQALVETVNKLGYTATEG